MTDYRHLKRNRATEYVKQKTRLHDINNRQEFQRLERINTLIEVIENNYKVKIAETEVAKIENFTKMFDSKWKSTGKSKVKIKKIIQSGCNTN